MDFSVSNAMFTVSEDCPSKVVATVRLETNFGGGLKHSRTITVTRDLGGELPKEVFEPLHQEPVAEGRAGNAVASPRPQDSAQ